MQTDCLRRFGPLTYGAEEGDDADAETGHGEGGSYPCQSATVERESGTEGCQICTPLGEGDARIGWRGFSHGYKKFFLLARLYKGILEQLRCLHERMEKIICCRGGADGYTIRALENLLLSGPLLRNLFS